MQDVYNYTVGTILQTSASLCLVCLNFSLRHWAGSLRTSSLLRTVEKNDWVKQYFWRYTLSSVSVWPNPNNLHPLLLPLHVMDLLVHFKAYPLHMPRLTLSWVWVPPRAANIWALQLLFFERRWTKLPQRCYIRCASRSTVIATDISFLQLPCIDACWISLGNRRVWS